MQILLTIIITIANFLSILIVADAILSWILPPFNPIRAALGRILQPLYAPIRRVVPSLGGMDFTPIVALLLIQVIEQVLTIALRG